MPSPISRRDFLRLGAAAAAGAGLSRLAPTALAAAGLVRYNPFPLPADERTYPQGEIGRVAQSNRISVYREPDWDSPIIGYLSARDRLIQLYYEITAPKGPAYNPIWYRVWDGYIHSAYVQKVRFRFNRVMELFPEAGVLCEVTVPYTNTYRYNAFRGWERLYRLYYQTTHWVIGAEPGPDGQPWYKIDAGHGLTYHAPAEHLRPIEDAEMAPLSPEVPPEEKRIEVVISTQTLTAYEGKDIVFQTSVSTGLPIKPDPDGIPWATPKGRFYIATKLPSQHMGEGNLTGDPEAYELPGVPWTVYFEPVTGVAFHGAYWHNNFGMQMSHGCVNMRPDEARWLFRWTTPAFTVPVLEVSKRERRGRGTLVEVL